MGVNVNEGRVVPGFDGVISDISEGRKEERTRTKYGAIVRAKIDRLLNVKVGFRTLMCQLTHNPTTKKCCRSPDKPVSSPKRSKLGPGLTNIHPIRFDRAPFHTMFLSVIRAR